jgi:hypothetical protein
MANLSLHQVTLLPKELIALKNVIRLSFEAFEKGNYPPYFECFLTAILQVIQLGSAAVMHAAPKVSINQYSLEIDQLASFLRDIKVIITAYTAIRMD